MKVPERERALREVAEQFRAFFPEPPREISWEKGDGEGLAFAAGPGGRTRFEILWSGSADAAHVAKSVRRFPSPSPGDRSKCVPIIAVPFMGEVGRRMCEEAGIGWMDLSGNAHIRSEALVIKILGNPSRFKRPGRPASVFAPQSSRIARWFLLHPEGRPTQRELARATGVDEGFASRLVRKLLETELLRRDPEDRLWAPKPGVLLDAWREAYGFAGHEILKGHIAARSSEQLLREVSKKLDSMKVGHAATGLSGAWLWDHYAMFRLVTFLVESHPSAEVLRGIGFREDPLGWNVWIAVANDRSVFEGAARKESVRVAHPLQVYLDLKDHPERSKEAAEEIRKNRLAWG